MNSSNQGGAARKSLLLILALILGGALSLVGYLRLRAPVARVIVESLSERSRSKIVVLVEGWLDRIKGRLLGPPKSVLLSARIIKFTPRTIPTSHPLPAPDYSDTNGMRIWIMADRHLQAFCAELQEAPGAEVIAQPRVQTASGIQGSIWIGQTIPIGGTNGDVGLGLDVLPKVRRASLDLRSTFRITETYLMPLSISPSGTQAAQLSIRTNLAARTRIQLPRDNGILMINADPAETNTPSMAIFIFPVVR